METPINSALSAELQELYLENKAWLSDIVFLEDEMRFFQKLFSQVLTGWVRREHLPQIAMISSSMNVILERRRQLKVILQSRKHTLEDLLKGNLLRIGLDLIEEDAAIICEIKSLMASEKVLKEGLFKLVEDQNENKPVLKNKLSRVHRYPLL